MNAVMKYRIIPIRQSSITKEDCINMIHLSFQERLEQGLRFTCSFMTVEDFEKKTEGKEILVASDSENGALMATLTYGVKLDYTGQKCAHIEYVAVSPDYKRLGLGSALIQECIRINSECDYISSDTAVRAKSSV